MPALLFYARKRENVVPTTNANKPEIETFPADHTRSTRLIAVITNQFDHVEGFVLRSRTTSPDTSFLLVRYSALNNRTNPEHRFRFWLSVTGNQEQHYQYCGAFNQVSLISKD
ncbi:hypothetical protein RRG08_000708 [Elysia crispata]|uniref:Uncharacterized protein n=1 Tax=Elysia crispata TaxID=231223 RepID=A0AAE1AWV4_9GAST|nr:hypothetical protein RRG08_000708 [Elysia crispata]